MKVEYSDKGRKPEKKKRKRMRKAKAVFLAFFAVVIVISVTVALMLTVFFNVKEIHAVGSSIYSADEIVYASGIMAGDNLLRLPSDEIEARIVTSLPFVKTAEVKKYFPDKVAIEVTPAEEAILLVTDNGNYTVDKDYKVLREVADAPDGLLRVVGTAVNGITVGNMADFSEKQQRDALNSLLSVCAEKGFDVNYVDIENIVDISFVIEDRLFIKIGTYNDLSGKLTHLETMMSSISEDITASISLTDWTVTNKKAVLKYEEIDGLMK